MRMVKEIILSTNKTQTPSYVALVDDEDFEYLSQFPWYVRTTPSAVHAKRDFYSDKKHFRTYMHMDVMKRVMGEEVDLSAHWIDHINGNGLDNRRENLRLVTRKQNAANRRPNKNSKTGIKGVRWKAKDNRYEVYVAGKYVGSSFSLEEAKEIRRQKAIEHYGDYANKEHP